MHLREHKDRGLNMTMSSADGASLTPGSIRAQAFGLPASWRASLGEFVASARFQALGAYLDERLEAGALVFPPRPFRALELTPFESVRVVILGQDPYHGPRQAHGLAFSVPEGMPLPPSLRNIFTELHGDLGIARPRSGDLSGWARQGVLLLNTVMTVEAGKPGSHAGKGWETFTDRIVGALARDMRPKVFMLWGAPAQTKSPLIEEAADKDGCFILRANHPSPLSARRPPIPFIGCRHFSRANAFLAAHGREPIDWAL
jgi:uracil-DNA glycosylase